METACFLYLMKNSFLDVVTFSVFWENKCLLEFCDWVSGIENRSRPSGNGRKPDKVGLLTKNYRLSIDTKRWMEWPTMML